MTEDTSDTAWVRNWEQSSTLLALRELIQLGRRITPAVARRGGMTVTEMSVLEHLSHAPLGPAELSHRLGVTSAAVSGILDRLSARGHVERRPHASDRRRTEVHLTASGRREAVGLLLPMFQELAAADGELDERQREVVLRYLVRVNGAIRRVL